MRGGGAPPPSARVHDNPRNSPVLVAQLVVKVLDDLLEDGRADLRQVDRPALLLDKALWGVDVFLFCGVGGGRREGDLWVSAPSGGNGSGARARPPGQPCSRTRRQHVADRVAHAGRLVVDEELKVFRARQLDVRALPSSSSSCLLLRHLAPRVRARSRSRCATRRRRRVLDQRDCARRVCGVRAGLSPYGGRDRSTGSVGFGGRGAGVGICVAVR